MTEFAPHDLDTAPEASRPLLEASRTAFGRIPGLHGVMAEAPALLDGYKHLHRLFQEETSFDADEITVVWQTINAEHACHYCVPAHTGIAMAMGVSDEISNALRDETPLPSDRLETLRAFTLKLVRGRGVVAPEEVDAFIAAGFTRQQVLEIVLGIAQKVMSNYTNHLADTPVDKAMQKFAWEKAGARAA